MTDFALFFLGFVLGIMFCMCVWALLPLVDDESKE